MTIIVCTTPKDDNNSKTMQALREKLPPCPICGRKAYLSHDVVDGADARQAFNKWVKYCERYKENKK